MAVDVRSLSRDQETIGNSEMIMMVSDFVFFIFCDTTVYYNDIKNSLDFEFVIARTEVENVNE